MSSTDASGLVDTDDDGDLTVAKSKLSVLVKAKESKRPDKAASAPRSESFRFKKRLRIALAGSDSDSTFESRETKGNDAKAPSFRRWSCHECIADENGVFKLRLCVQSHFALRSFPYPESGSRKLHQPYLPRSLISAKARSF